jgi:hypothetical protein
MKGDPTVVYLMTGYAGHRAIVLNVDERALGARDPWSPGCGVPERPDPVRSRETRRFAAHQVRLRPGGLQVAGYIFGWPRGGIG